MARMASKAICLGVGIPMMVVGGLIVCCFQQKWAAGEAVEFVGS